MNKILVEFISKEDIERLFVPSYRKVLSPSAVQDFLLSFVNEKGALVEEKIAKKVEPWGFNSKARDPLHWDLFFAVKRIKKKIEENDDSGFNLMFPIMSDGFRGEALIEDCFNGKAVQNSPLDNIVMQDWEVRFSKKLMDSPIYPNVGLLFHPECPEAENFKVKFEAEPYERLSWFELSEIYHSYFPKGDKNNVKQYYADMRSIGLYPSVSMLPFFVFKSLGALNDGVTFGECHKASINCYIEY